MLAGHFGNQLTFIRSLCGYCKSSIKHPGAYLISGLKRGGLSGEREAYFKSVLLKKFILNFQTLLIFIVNAIYSVNFIIILNYYTSY